VRFRYGSGKSGVPEKKALVYTQDEHGIDPADVDADAAYVTGQLRRAGYETYIVGGAVRDLILGKKPKDFDIASAASPQQIKRLFRTARIIGRRFRLVHVHFGAKIIEVATFRSMVEGSVGNVFGTIEDDVKRRDFSCNALFYEPDAQIVVDYVDGLADIRAKRLRPLIQENAIFSEDPVRMIRAVKYAAQSGFSLPLTLRRRIRKQGPLLAEVSASRLTEEISKIIHGSSSAEVIDALDTAGLYQWLQPQAVRRFRASADFRNRYLASFAALARSIASGGKPRESAIITPLFRDFLEDEVDWKDVTEENYYDVFQKARSFVLPMNPQRVEMDRAVRALFAERGLHVKRSIFAERDARRYMARYMTRSRLKDISGAADGEAAATDGAEAGQKKTARRRRARKRRAARG